MNTLTVTSHKKVDCSPGDVIINLLSQLLMVVLLKILSDTFGMVEAFCAGLAYVILIMVSGCNTIPFFFYGKPAVALATIFTYVALGIRCSTITFYFQEYVNLQALTIWMNQWGFHVVREEAYTSGLILFVALGVITQLLGVILFTAFVARHINKIVFYILCIAATALLNALCYLPQPDDITMIYLLSVLKSLAYIPTVPLIWSLICRTTDNLEYPTQCSTTGFCFHGIKSTMKAGLGIGATLSGLILIGYGYVSASADEVSWHTIQGIRLLSSIVPAALFAVSALVLLLFPNKSI